MPVEQVIHQPIQETQGLKSRLAASLVSYLYPPSYIIDTREYQTGARQVALLATIKGDFGIDDDLKAKIDGLEAARAYGVKIDINDSNARSMVQGRLLTKHGIANDGARDLLITLAMYRNQPNWPPQVGRSYGHDTYETAEGIISELETKHIRMQTLTPVTIITAILDGTLPL